MAEQDTDEDTPLLSSSRRGESSESSTLLEETRIRDDSNTISTADRSFLSRLTDFRHHLHRYKTLYLAGLFLFIADAPGLVGETAELGMLQIAVCREYYSRVNGTMPMDWQGDIPEELCQIPDIQAKLAEVRGIRQTLYFAIGIIMDRFSFVICLTFAHSDGTSYSVWDSCGHNWPSYGINPRCDKHSAS
jgi:hypothetical protein